MRLAAVAACSVVMLGGGNLCAQPYVFGYAARVNDTVISNRALDQNFEEYLRDNNVNIGAIRYPDRIKAMKLETLGLLIDQELLWQAAEAEGTLASTREVDEALAEMRSQFRSDESFLNRLIDEGYTEESYRDHLFRLVSARKFREALVADIVVSDADIHTYYLENPERFRIPESVRARHILVAVKPTDGDAAMDAARARIETILERLELGADFAELASRFSDDSSAARGGDLGYFPRGQMVDSFEQAAFSLEPGELSDVVQTPYGLHLIKVESRQPSQIVDEELVREDVRNYLFERERAQRLEHELASLRAAADIEIP